MSGNSNFLLSLSILFPLLIGLVSFKKVRQNYRPFLVYIILSFISEIISYTSAKVFKTNLPWLNVFDLIECLILFIQFGSWGLLRKNRNIYYCFLGILFIGWITDNFLFSDIYHRNRVFLISYSFLLVLVSIREINQAMILSNESLYENARFIICIGMILYFTFHIIDHTFRLFGSGFSPEFRNKVSSIGAYTNVITNIVYAFGVYYIPKITNRERFFY